mmetsp:Transcript_23647/g.93345  ORF Transcript_23647/g.93345 Transcript_23647/m.93345 type:complete len:119 (-) Transcript_23647:1863-2219(-)
MKRFHEQEREGNFPEQELITYLGISRKRTSKTTQRGSTNRRKRGQTFQGEELMTFFWECHGNGRARRYKETPRTGESKNQLDFQACLTSRKLLSLDAGARRYPRRPPANGSGVELVLS